eukprot:2649663-Ditylum_brightwellii.AAC.1
MHTGGDEVDDAVKDVFKYAREMKTPLHQNRNKCTKCKAAPIDKQQDNFDTINDISIVKPVEVKVSNERREAW